MINHNLKRTSQNIIEISTTIPWEIIKKEYEIAFDLLQKDYSFEGFRKGKVPRSIAEKNIPKDTVYSQLIRALFPRIYEEIVKTNNLKPIISPKVELVKAEENKEWELKIMVAEKPEIKLDGYKETIKKAKAELKKDNIWIPGKDKNPSDEKSKADQSKLLNTVLDAVLKNIKCDIADLIIEDELNRRLSHLVDDVQKIGLTMDNYLKSKQLTMDNLKSQLTKEIKDTYKLEFILAEIADKEGVKVEDSDINKLLSSITDPKEKEEARKNAYYYATILRKQKTLDFLINL